MRISAAQAAAILRTISGFYGDHPHVWLFGSRADDAKRGGDVDLYVEADDRDALKRIRCRARLSEALDLKVDLAVGTGNAPMFNIARQRGVRLR